MSKPKKENNSSCVCLALNKCGRIITQEYDQAFRPLGIGSKQFSLLRHVDALMDASVTTIANMLCMNQTTATRAILLLEKEGYVITRAHAEDGRKKQVILTSAGRRKLSEAMPIWKKVNADITKKIGKEKTAVLLELSAEIAAIAGDV